MAAETAQTLDRGLRILALVAASDTRFTINEIAESLEISRTVAYRLIVTLEEHDLLHRDDQGRIVCWVRHDGVPQRVPARAQVARHAGAQPGWPTPAAPRLT